MAQRCILAILIPKECIILIIIVSVSNSKGELAGQIVARIKEGDVELRDKFINDYIPFILKVISNTVSNKEGLKNCDEYSIGLIAFNEAIDKFDSQKSTQAFNFFSFSEQIIKRRIIDYTRNVMRRKKEIPISSFEGKEESIYEKYYNEPSMPVNDRIELFEEIKSFGKELGNFGLKIRDLSKYTPKHRDSRKMCVNIAKKITANKEIYHKVISKKRFPMKELSKIIDVSPRTLERNREFIISASIIYGNGYERLQSYLGNDNYGRDTSA